MTQFRKLSLLVLPLVFLLVGCQPQSASKSHTATSTTSKTTSSAPSSKKKTPANVKLTKVALLGTWQSTDGIKFTFGADGKWVYETANAAKTDGTFMVAAAAQHDLLLKLHGLDQDIGGIGNYLGLRFSANNKKLNIVGFGQFTLQNDASPITANLLLPHAFNHRPQTLRQELVGTWMDTDESATDALTTNYNPDGSYERYRSSNQQVERGHFTVANSHEDSKQLQVKFTPEDGKAYTTNFTKDSEITQLTSTSKGVTSTYVKNQMPN